jgi:glycosyltransferase involved in cell wall biosynthesis
MKIAIVVYSFLPKNIAGTEMATYNIAKRFNNHEVIVLTSLDKGLPSESIMDGFKVYRIPRPGKNNKIGVYLSAPLFWTLIFFKVWQLKPNLVHFQGLSTGISGIPIKKILNIPYMVYARGSDVYLSNPLIGILHKSILNNSSAIIALTDHMKKKLMESTDKKIYTIPNGIDLDKFTVNENKKFLRKKLGISINKTIIIFVGRLHVVKGLEYLINAVNKVKNDNLKLFIIGDGTERENLEKLSKKLNIENYIEFCGEIPNEKIPEYLTASDIFVLPSLSEGFPNVLLEAMTCGLPVIATKIKGLDEIIEEGINGYLINPKSSEQIAEKIEFISKNKTIYKTISQNNKIRASEFSWDPVIDRLDEIYKKTLED